MQQPLVSVVIPAYNHARYLPQAIESVLVQDYSNVEILVVDDGSTDNTKDVVAAYPSVVYVHQSNSGLSAARNTGIDKSQGEYLSFLDADDWFFVGGLTSLAKALQENPQAAFVYGSYETVNESNEIVPEVRQRQDYGESIYAPLLENNFVTVPAAVLYRRLVFEQFRFDPAFPSAADYSLYLNVTRHHSVIYLPRVVAAYRRHGHNMSNNIPLMLREVMSVLKKQKAKLKGGDERARWRKGRQAWKDRYGNLLLRQLERKKFFSRDANATAIRAALFRYNKKLFLGYLCAKLSAPLKTAVRKMARVQRSRSGIEI